MANDRTYRVLILGDFHYGESYSRAGARILAREGYHFSTKHLEPFIDYADAFVLNLETPLATEEEFPSPLRRHKTYIHWADPDGTGRALKSLGVDAVSLANNHTVDLGHEALESSFDALGTVGIPWFGAGRTRNAAEEPFRIPLPDSIGGGEIDFHASFQYSKSHDEEFHFYATEQKPGCAKISRDAIVSPADHEVRPDTLHIAFPHWGKNYAWRTPGQERLATQLTSAGYHLVLGHGSHAIQEIHRSTGQWVVYGIGNGNFQSGGRWKKYETENEIVPFSFWTVLEVARTESGDRRVFVNLYPVYSDNSKTGFQPRPVSREDFDRVAEALAERAEPLDSIPGEHMSFAQDDLGHYIRLEIADWPVGEPALPLRQGTADPDEEAALKGLAPADVLEGADSANVSERITKRFPSVLNEDPNAYEDPESQSIIRDQIERGRSIGALVISRAAVRDGAHVKWHGRYFAVLSKANKDVLAHGHMCTETHVSAHIVRDKLLTKQLLQQAGVATPGGTLAKDPLMAVEIQRRLGCPVVIKPRIGGKGQGITVGVSRPEDIKEAFSRASAGGREVLVEEYIDGVEFRILASDQECFGAVRRLLPHVVGDGISTIGELIEQKNALRRRNPNNRLLLIPMDEVMESYLHVGGLSLHHVLPRGDRKIVRNVGGISGGGEAQECFSTVDKTVLELATASVGAIPSMNWGGADILLSRRTGRPYLLELNTNAAISNSTYPVYGQPKDVGGIAWQRMFAESRADEATIVLPKREGEPISVMEALVKLQIDLSSSETLAKLFRIYLKRRGWTVTTLAGRADRVRSPEGVDKWFRGCADQKLPSTVAAVLFKHRTVRTIQRDRGVEMPRATRIRNAPELADYAARAAQPITIVPWSAGWNSAHFLTDAELSHKENTGTASMNVLAQTAPKGERFRVFASRVQPLLVIGRRRADGRVNDPLTRAGELAVHAVRAIPGLRWAAVDVVVPESMGTTPLVEGLSMNATFEGAEVVISGDFESLFSAIADEDVTTLRGGSC